MRPIRIITSSTEQKYKMNVEKIKYQVEALQSGNFERFGNHLTYSIYSGNKMYDKLIEAGVNCEKRKSIFKDNSIDIIFHDVPNKSIKN